MGIGPWSGMHVRWSKCHVKKFVIACSFAACAPLAFGANIVDTLSHAGSFRLFSAALKTCGLDETLKQSGPYTVFAPSDSAIARLPKGEWNAIAKDKARLADLLAHHVLRGKIVVAEAKPGDVATLGGSPVHLASDNGLVSIANAKVTLSDIQADNGVIHEVDALVLPDSNQE